jgi:chromosome condensin MukBEF ATPase and DNA-binding subunit MukB
MLISISPQLESIDAIADKYQFSEESRNLVYQQAIQALMKANKSPSILNVLYKVLFSFTRSHEKDSTDETKKCICLLYSLAIQMSSVPQYNQLIELSAYKLLKEVRLVNDLVTRK